MAKPFLTLLLFLFFQITFQAFPQRYGTALGLRFGNSDFNRTLGLTLQQRLTERVTLEGIIQSDFNLNSTFSLLLERHRPIISKRFNYYLGGGASFGKEESFVKNPATKEIVHTYGNATFGVDLVAGIELTIANAVIALDYKPNINISGREEFYRGQVGISARTVLVKSKEQKRRQKQRQKAKKASQQQTKKPFSDLFK
ncbi:hypothetical protein J0A67_07425 [Algoriphagus aestuariicola]|uniref:Outer membrane protein beta-barrel domain-containing protein n=1 Tax=Algoriphagus aestuariicola TaxID=1852016 RepID=A0ABS3BQR6_9BACT|nr:hypothetical protein [Algoriphagus aestuariicola]MBN7800685.1 hypothetical protein [Algoriphagus aestuariicola]